MLLIEFYPNQSNTINLDILEYGMPGITPRFGASLAEAAAHCLEEHDHQAGVQLNIDGDCIHRLRMIWKSKDDQSQRSRCWGDPEEATEHGAYGIAALLITELTEYTVLERAKKGPGFDFWLGKKGSLTPLFQDKARLEVSGIRSGNEQALETRMRRKLKQTDRSDGVLPGIIAVVEFSSPRSRVRVK